MFDLHVFCKYRPLVKEFKVIYLKYKFLWHTVKYRKKIKQNIRKNTENLTKPSHVSSKCYQNIVHDVGWALETIKCHFSRRGQGHF